MEIFLVKNFWITTRVEGWAAYVMKEKLKLLKIFLARWNKEEFGHIDTKIANQGDEIKMLDLKGESTMLDEEEIDKRKGLLGELWEISRMKESLLFQKI